MDIDFLTEEQIKDGTKMIVEAGCNYAKTSSGQFHGPTLEQFLAMKSVCEGTKTKTKVAGVKFPRPQNAYVFLLAGTDLIGTRAAGPMIDALQQMRDLGSFLSIKAKINIIVYFSSKFWLGVFVIYFAKTHCYRKGGRKWSLHLLHQAKPSSKQALLTNWRPCKTFRE